MLPKVCVELNCYHICQKTIEFRYIQVPNVTSKNVSWLHFSWPTLYLCIRWWRGVVVNALVLVNEVTLCPVSTWMCDRLRTGKPCRYVTSHPGQLSLAIPPWVGAMNTSKSWGVNGHTARPVSHRLNDFPAGL